MADRKLLNSELGRMPAEEYSSAGSSGFVIVLDNVRSAHNVGSAFRTGDGFHVDKVLLCGICAVPPSAELHKTALGAEMCVPWMHFDNTLDAVEYLRGEGYTIVSVEQTENSLSLEKFAAAGAGCGTSGKPTDIAARGDNDADGRSADVNAFCQGVDSACGKYAFVFGNEVAGVAQEVVDASDFSLEIPQYGTKHSFNVSVSIGIVLWQALRSRLL